MDETLIDAGASNETETTEIIGVSEECFNRHMVSISNLLQVQAVGLGLLVGCIVSLAVVRWFHVR